MCAKQIPPLGERAAMLRSAGSIKAYAAWNLKINRGARYSMRLIRTRHIFLFLLITAAKVLQRQLLRLLILLVC